MGKNEGKNQRISEQKKKEEEKGEGRRQKGVLGLQEKVYKRCFDSGNEAVREL